MSNQMPYFESEVMISGTQFVGSVRSLIRQGERWQRRSGWGQPWTWSAVVVRRVTSGKGIEKRHKKRASRC